MRRVCSLPVRRALRMAIAAVAVAMVVVPALARAHQRVERRDATRLSIKHSWIGVAPPSKSSIAPQQIDVLPTVRFVSTPAPRERTARAVVAPTPRRHPVLDFSPDPLRGPPSVRS